MDQILVSLKDDNPLLIVITIVLVLLTNYKKVLEFFEDIRHRKVKQIQLLLDNEALDEKTREHLKTQLNDEAFKLTTGITCNKFFRLKLLEIFEKGKGDFSLTQVKRADQYIHFEQGKIYIKIYLFEKVFAITSAISGIILIASVSISFSQVVGVENILQSLILVMIYIIILGIGFLGVLHLVFILVAKKLDPIFKELQKDESKS